MKPYKNNLYLLWNYKGFNFKFAKPCLFIKLQMQLNH